jgi:hypothetical protein
MIDLKRSHSDMRLSRLLAAGTVVEQEGVLLCAVLEDGVEKAALVASVSGSEKVIGFSMTGDSQPSQTSNVESFKVPSSGSYVAQLSKTNLVLGKVRFVAAGSALAVITSGSPAAGQVLVNHSTGALSFNAAEAGKSFVATYIYELTLSQSRAAFGQRHINNNGLHAEFGQVEVQAGHGELYTDQFDAAVDFSVNPTLTLGDNGIVTVGGAGPELNASVVHVPNAENPLLGIRFNF